MSNYSRILNEFVQKLGFNEGDRFNQYGINQALDKLLQINAQQTQFNRQVSGEIFQQTPKNVDGTVTLREYINTIIRANEILFRSISETEKQMQVTNDPNQRNQLQLNIDQFTDDLILLTRTFNLPGPSRSSRPVGAAPSGRSQMSNEFPRRDSRLGSSNHSGIFAEEPSEREESSSLKIALILLLICFLFELILMFVKHHYMNCLTYIALFGVYFLNYFDRNYIRVCLILLLASLVLDFVWLLLMASPYWDNLGGHRSSFRHGFLKFCYVMTIILMVAKAVIMIIFYRYRNNNENTRKCVRILNIRFDLDGRPVASPVHNLLAKNDSNYAEAQAGMY